MTEDELTGALMSDRVRNKGSDYRFEGLIVAMFQKRDGGAWRCVVENDDGILHIFSAKNLERVRAMEKSK